MNEAVERLLRFKKDHWAFLTECTWTLDQADKAQPIKQYPNKAYLKYLSDRMVEETLFALIKHRRMIASWTMCGVFLHDAMFNEGRFNAIMSKKEEDADELVRRCLFIYENIPASALPVKPKHKYKYTELSFPEIDSKIKAFAQGTHQLRQYTCSRIAADEIAFWPFALQAFVAMKPTIEGGGKITLLSTRFPGFYKDLIEDTLDI